MNAKARKRNRFLSGFGTLVVASTLFAAIGASAQIPANLQVPPGNEIVVACHAEGVQIYISIQKADGSFAWTFKAPEATLYVLDGDEVSPYPFAIHYAGPTWEANNGSKVMGSVLQRATVDPSAIPWLLLKGVVHDGHGVFSHVTYVQRLYTTGGIAPAVPPTGLGQQARVPYTAIYVFWNAM